MREIFVVIKNGVYDHGIVGFYDNFQQALKEFPKSLPKDEDYYHRYRLERLNLETLEVEVLGFFGLWKKNKWFVSIKKLSWEDQNSSELGWYLKTHHSRVTPNIFLDLSDVDTVVELDPETLKEK